MAVLAAVSMVPPVGPSETGRVAAGLKLADPYAQLDLCPMGDGGEGTVDALVKATVVIIGRASISCTAYKNVFRTSTAYIHHAVWLKCIPEQVNENAI